MSIGCVKNKFIPFIIFCETNNNNKLNWPKVVHIASLDHT
jgi:hypothetical protein